MALIDTYTSNDLTALISDMFGEKLEALNLDEMLNILWDIVANIGDAEAEISQEASEAAIATSQIMENPTEAMKLILGLTDLLDDRVCTPLSGYTSHWWAESAMDNFGNSLERLTTNERSWILYRLLQRVVDTDEFHYEEEMESIGEWLEINTSENIEQSELILVARALALMAIERFNSEAAAA